MKGRNFASLGVWTIGYLLVAVTLFLLSADSQCPRGPEGAACGQLSGQIQLGIAVVLTIAYVLITWTLFFRRR